MLTDFLAQCFSQYVSVTKVAKHLSRVVGVVKTIVDCAASTGCAIVFDHDTRSFVIQAATTDYLLQGVESIGKHVQECEELVGLLTLDKTDSWLLVALLNKRESLKEIEESTSTKVEIIREDNSVSILGETKESIISGKKEIISIFEQMKRENAFVDIPESSMMQFVGNSSRQINNFAAINGVKMDRVKKSTTCIRIQGHDTGVKTAVVAINTWVQKWEANNPGTTIKLHEDTLMCLLDNKTTSEKKRIQRICGVKLDVCVTKSNVTIRGGKGDSTSLAIEQIRALAESLDIKASKAEEKPAQALDTKPVNIEIDAPTPKVEKNTSVLMPTLKTTTNVQVPEKLSIPTTVVGKDKSKEPKRKEQSGKLQSVSKLYSFLVSEDAAPMAAGEEPWDSSTVSSGVENVVKATSEVQADLQSASSLVDDNNTTTVVGKENTQLLGLFVIFADDQAT
eukprot:CAMPEP_0197240468 /NCGR_PEP_ID=MMETSP1429-20130617/6748_1 /TAXON_ID=49237 /ORGANISM="Chaetoceros  sp., Strain UNC1202" /LENGTH=451 /DNA_ID=CAMNT_0042700113 /DNA_START=42 /DNA_END=1398 /DNA_ORIENTATION=+